MRVGLVVQALERTPPVRSGAVERTVWYLAERLVELGHEVTLFASGDSVTSARLVPACDRALLHDLEFEGQQWWVATVQAAQVVRMQAEFDVINSHAGYALLSALPAIRVPVTSTWHGFMHRPVTRRILREYAPASLMATSDYQRRATADLGLNWLAMVHNGVATSDVAYHATGERSLVFLARMARDKRPDLAIRVALAAGLPIRLAGKVLDQDYFDHAVRPLLRHPDVEYLGELVGGEKRELLGRAHALVHPSEYEACSNVIIEAMGSGAPVVCLDRSSNAELVQHGVTGFVCGSPNELVDACRRAGEIDRGACRRRYLDHFTVERMVDGYLAAYERLLAG